MATRVGPGVQWIADFPQADLPCRERDHGWQHGNVALSQAILGVRGPKSKIEEQSFVECHMER